MIYFPNSGLYKKAKMAAPRQKENIASVVTLCGLLQPEMKSETVLQAADEMEAILKRYYGNENTVGFAHFHDDEQSGLSIANFLYLINK